MSHSIEVGRGADMEVRRLDLNDSMRRCCNRVIDAGIDSKLLDKRKRISSVGGKAGRSESSLRPRSSFLSEANWSIEAGSVRNLQSFRSSSSTAGALPAEM
eukprot:scaffold104338_cov27-Tisochrysis_lutea.AAC.2